VSIIENLGEPVMASVDIGGTEPLIVKLPGTSAVKAGDGIALTADPARLHLFDARGRAIR
jgi:alpha-glucoside transport system ATP-binding protein